VTGTVYDSSRQNKLEAVTVLSTGGQGTYTDANGQYIIITGAKDSIWFSYLGKPTIKFPILKIADVNQFDIALRVNIPVLKEVRLLPRSYKQDSLQNRLDYAKAFNFQKPNLKTMTSIGPMGAGIDINELIRLFQFQRNKNTLRFQERLLQQERDQYITHRFNKQLVRRLTNLHSEELERFLRLYRPTYEFAISTREYEFQLYIKESFEKFSQKKSF
jgi:hypothetical protein